MKSPSMSHWLYRYFKFLALYTAVFALWSFFCPGDLYGGLLLFLPAVPALPLCYLAGVQMVRRTPLPALGGGETALFLLLPPAIFWIAFCVFALLPGGIYLGLPLLILAFALRPVLVLYAILALVLGAAASRQPHALPFLLLISLLPGPPFFLGTRRRIGVDKR